MHGGDGAPLPEARALLEVADVTFGYSARASALRDISFSLAPGERVGLVGPNGSGKSTLIRLVADLLQVRRGSVTIDGRPNHTRASREQLCYIASNDTLPQFLTGREYIELMHRLYRTTPDAAAVDDLLDRYQMGARQFDLIEDYSHGMRKKIQLVSALSLGRPLTIIDETLNGVDVDALFEFEIDAARIADDRGLLLCSHDFRLLENVCDRVIVLCRGEIVFDLPTARVLDDVGSVDALVRRAIAIARTQESP
ncbi:MULTISPECIES: ATP-binding cassette domain-containing protein [Microbacterium]|uniref:ATP-binding cassette domain-containing protein n=2 Tax=Microbacteriaceae TaxID=85023 RepID=UPI000AF800EA|nr:MULTISPECIES: ABC transporter ATP-binding protein [Microbacterium]